MPASPTLRRRRLARELRQLRAAAGLSLGQVAQRLRWESSKLSRMENARRSPTVGDMLELLDVYGVPADRREALIALTRESRRRGWWHTYRDLLPEVVENYVGLEAEASSVHTYQGAVIPGLLQTADYAQALTRGTVPAASDEEVRRRAELRIQRQDRLTDSDPLELWAVISEAALRQLVGGHTVQATQLGHLRQMATLPHIMVQVMPLAAAAHPGLTSSFSLLRFADPLDPSVVYVDTQLGGLWLEEESEVDYFAAQMDHLRAMAADPARSAAMIAKIEQEIERGA